MDRVWLSTESQYSLRQLEPELGLNCTSATFKSFDLPEPQFLICTMEIISIFCSRWTAWRELYNLNSLYLS